MPHMVRDELQPSVADVLAVDGRHVVGRGDVAHDKIDCYLLGSHPRTFGLPPARETENAGMPLILQIVVAWYTAIMPELSRFFGIIIRMYMEVGQPHNLPHFHAYYQNDVAIFSLDPIELIAGSLPRRQQRLAEAWAELHQAELQADWQRLQSGLTPWPIDPLE